MSFLAEARAKLSKRDLTQVSSHGGRADSVHSYDPREVERYVLRVNKIMASEPGFAPLEPSSFFKRIADGSVMLTLLDKCETGCVSSDVRAKLTSVKSSGLKQGMESFKNAELLTAFIEGARAIGLETSNLGASDFVKAVDENKQHLILGLVWQLLRRQLANEIKTILKDQEAARAKRGKMLNKHFSETMANVLKDPETFLAQWVNETMKQKGLALPNGGKGLAGLGDLSSSANDSLLRLLHALHPSAATSAALPSTSPEERAQACVQWVTEQGIVSFSTPEDLSSTSTRLLLPFAMQIFTYVASLPGKEMYYVVRTHSFTPAGAGSGKAVSKGGSAGVFKKADEAVKAALVANLNTLVSESAPLPELTKALATERRSTREEDELKLITLGLGPIPALCARDGRSEDVVRDAIRAWVHGTAPAAPATAPADGGAAGGSAVDAEQQGITVEEAELFQANVLALLKAAPGKVLFSEVDEAPRF